jgi:beta-1,4-mannosyl-glycoprotein beta-1,4-N-acetylglucosaminyltransferase
MTVLSEAPARVQAGRDETAEDLERQWHSSPGLGILRRAAEMARELPLNIQLTWSTRLRAAGLWSYCPLVATAQDLSLAPGTRALAAGISWGAHRDRQARAVLRRLLPVLDSDDRSTLEATVPLEALNDLEKGPFTWSVTPFFNELDLLEARLSEMARMVDRFVVIEARQTFRGQPKPLYFQENSHLFRRWAAQIDHVVVDLPEGPDAWARERHQRNVAHQVLADLGAVQDDLVLLTDLDEIVRADRVDAAREATAASPVVLMMTQYWYSLEWRQEDPWLHPKAFRYGQIRAGTPYHDVRHSPFPVLPNTGWHLSWFGDEARFDYKLASFSHSEFDTPERRKRGFSDGLIARGVDIHGRKLSRSGDHFPASLAKIFKAAR